MKIVVYTKQNCPNCVTAKRLLELKRLPFDEVNAEYGTVWRDLLERYPDARQMPQIFIDDQRVGGLAGLQAALNQIEGRDA